ncbi:hypothetical protein M8818_001595 [Zalaria obscura]|uniref:Uncharacterized protein n=1 Tax=Zalaria obscura TaxID=2024903 RepID=A0ACC3SK69_9PEZI
MELDESERDPFAVSDLWRKSTFTINNDPHETLFNNDLSFAIEFPELNIASHDRHGLSNTEDYGLRLPDLDAFEFGALEDLSPPESHRGEKSEGEDEIERQQDELGEDIWNVASHADIPAKAPALRTWEGFLDEQHAEPVSAYLSEVGPGVFDAALQQEEKGTAAASASDDVLQPAFVLRCLFSLALGRASVLFQWNDEKAVFEDTLENVRVSGCSALCSQSLIQRVKGLGNTTMELRNHVLRTYAAKSPLPAYVALAGCLEVILNAADKHLTSQAAVVRSFVAFESAIQVPDQLLHLFSTLLHETKSARSDHEVANEVYHMAQHSSGLSNAIQSIYADVLARVSEPWLTSLKNRVGLGDAKYASPDPVLPDFLDLVNGPSDSTNGHRISAADIVSPADSQCVEEIHAGLEILNACAPEHPLLFSGSYTSTGVRGQQSAYPDLERTLQRAKQYELELQGAINKYASGSRSATKETTELQTPARSAQPADENDAWLDDERQKQFLAAIGARCVQTPGTGTEAVTEDGLLDQLLKLFQEGDQEDDYSLDVSVAPLAQSPLVSLQPYLDVQSQAVNSSVLRLLFKECRLREHLSLQRSFHFFGNGVFLERLSSALFSADLDTAERMTGKVRTPSAMGLRLDVRDGARWPPASSELRLSLMGILSESYKPNHTGSEHNKSQDLPGGLSFSIRELPEADIERVLDPGSIYALDFLRLQYAAPHPVNSVITADSLQKYDEIFRFLLRLLRVTHLTTLMKASIAGIYSATAPGSGHDGIGFATEAHHIMSTLHSHFFAIGISAPWATLDRELAHVEETLDKTDASTMGLQALRQLHDAMLDSVRTRLLQRRKQEKLLNSVNSIFTIILQASRSLQDQQVGSDMRSLRERLTSEARTLVKLLEEASDKALKRRAADKKEKEDLETFNILRLRLDMSGYYSTARPGDQLLPI